MVEETLRGGRVIFTCGVCGLGYGEEETAKDCEEYCSKHDSCSLEITRKAIYRPSFE